MRQGSQISKGKRRHWSQKWGGGVSEVERSKGLQVTKFSVTSSSSSSSNC
uniref:Uncharacterized protein n=1 Tax=Octopus bimaculoides TaxID=37653 RepID=A0A0L8FHU9_OCTBM